MEIPKVFLYLLVIATCISICAGMFTVITVDDKFNGVFLDSYGKTLDMVTFLKKGNKGNDIFINFIKTLKLKNFVRVEDLEVELYKGADNYLYTGVETNAVKKAYKFCAVDIEST